METIENFFSYDNGHVLNKKLGKLISYAHDLHERDFNYYCNIPTFKFIYLGSSIFVEMICRFACVKHERIIKE